MISLDDVLKVHEQLINKYGGSYGIRDKSLLESALNRPFTTYNQTDLYPTPIEKATALLESVISNHPFVDGNKRTGYFLFRAYLLEFGLDIDLTQEEKYTFVINIASGKLKGNELTLFVKEAVPKKHS